MGLKIIPDISPAENRVRPPIPFYTSSRKILFVLSMNRINQGLIKAFLRIKPNKPDWGFASKHAEKVNVSRSYDMDAFRIWYQSPASFNNWLGFVAVVPLGKDDQAPRWSNMALINISLITEPNFFQCHTGAAPEAPKRVSESTNPFINNIP